MMMGGGVVYSIMSLCHCP